MENLTKSQMTKALTALDENLKKSEISLIIGGGGAMILAHGFPLATADIDGVPKGISIQEIDPLIKKIGKELSIAPDWLNPYYSTFMYTLPDDYESRLIDVFNGKNLRVRALGLNDMLVMKCFAGRAKDIAHAKALIKKGADIDFVNSHIESLQTNSIPGSEKAIEFLDEIQD